MTLQRKERKREQPCEQRDRERETKDDDRKQPDLTMKTTKKEDDVEGNNKQNQRAVRQIEVSQQKG